MIALRQPKGTQMQPIAGLRNHTSRAVLIAAALLPVLAAPAAAPESRSSKHFVLPATPENVQWGWYDINEPPKLTIHSGDTVSIETLSHSLGQIKPGVPMDEIVKLRKGNPGGGRTRSQGPSTWKARSPATRWKSTF